MKSACVYAFLALGLLAHTAQAESAIRFNRDVRPILSDHCYACHGPDAKARKAKLRLDVRSAAVDGDAIVPGEPDASELVKRILHGDPDEWMPPADFHKPLTASQKQTLRRWIAEGAAYERHWSFEPVRRPKPPEVKGTVWPKNPIDRFILTRLEAEQLAPSPQADRATLVRRVTLDLTGLPPTPEAVDAYVRDTQEGAYEQLVDRLMSTKAYAERRAQDWLDLARYADTRGFADDKMRQIWPYRDWVIRAIDRNMPFDRFTIEQLAGDMLPDATIDQRLASAFHRNAPQAKGTTYPVEEYRLKGVVDRVNTTGQVWLGLTLSCAECHDHKFDPVTQRDYYALFAMFNNTVHSGSGFGQGGPKLRVPDSDQAQRLASLERQLRELDAEVKARAAKLGTETAKTDAELKAMRKTLTDAKKARDALLKQVPLVPVMQEMPKPRKTFIHVRGSFLNHGEQVSPGVPAFFNVATDRHPRNRLDFARWLVDGKNPLVARVVVNRLWQTYFGYGLVRSANDFGLQGEMPSHPELLDWLADEFVDSGWDMKHVHRLIVTSATYRQSARTTSEHQRDDPKNILLTRMPRVRLPGEQIRDQALAVSGLLVSKVGGPSVFPRHPVGYWQQRALPGKWTPSREPDRYRRTMYTYWRRMALHPSLELLDAPARELCVARRDVSNVPTQALVLLNDPIFTEAAAALAARVLREAEADDAARIEHGFRLVLGRSPDAEERSRFLAYITDERIETKNALSVWTQVCSVLLNLDEAITRP